MNSREGGRIGPARRATTRSVVYLLALFLSIATPAVDASHRSPLKLPVTAASGWTDPANVLTDGDNTHAHTSNDGSTLTLGAFADAATRGAVSNVVLKIDQQQISHNDDRLILSASASGCTTVTPADAAPEPTSSRTVLSIQLTCTGAWSWARVNALTASLRTNAIGGIPLLFDGVDGEWRVYHVWAEVTYSDTVPAADAGTDQSVAEGATVVLDGSASSDPEGLTLLYAWTQVGGAAVSLGSPATAKTSFVAPLAPTNAPLLLSFQLAVTDADEHAAIDVIQVVVNNVNQAPLANAGVDQFVETGSSVSLNGASSSDPDQDVLSYAWTQTAGAGVTLTGATTATPSFKAPNVAGSLTFRLIVTDAVGLASAPDSMTVSVRAPSAAATTPASTAPTTAPTTTTPATTPPPTTPPVPAPTLPTIFTTITVSAPPPTGDPGAPAPASCSVTIPASDKVFVYAVPMATACGLASAFLAINATPVALNLTVQSLGGLPAEIDGPTTKAALGAVVKVLLVDDTGAEHQPLSATLRFAVSSSWLRDECPASRCQPRVFHLHGDEWTPLNTSLILDDGTTALLEAQASGFSLFSVGGVAPAVPVGPTKQGIGWLPWLVVGAALATAGATGLGFALRKRKEDAATPAADPAADSRVGRLLKEMRANEQLLQFVNNAAHDLANPLTPIRIQLHMLENAASTTDNKEHRKSLAIVQRNVEQLAMLITDLRDASKLQAGQLRLSRDRIDLARVAAEAVESYHGQALHAGIDLAFERSDAQPVDADAGRLIQVLTNFLNNALKFTPRGGHVTVRVLRDGPMVTAAVQDSGLGLGAEDRQRLFKPFSQVHGEREKKKGTGLGLYISKGIAEAHGGRIGCESDGPGHGSTFWFSIPAAGPNGPTAAAEIRPAAPEAPAA